MKINYEQEISQWNWKLIVENAQDNLYPASERMDLGDDDGYVGYEYLGSCFSLTPSGKYYLPFAYSNLDPCPTCNWSGQQPEKFDCCHICKGEGWRYIQDFANLRNESVDDAMDHLLNTCKDITVEMDRFSCNLCKGKGEVPTTCETCGGLGSQEAYLDELWFEALDNQARLHGGWIESGEGDPTDIFFCVLVNEKEARNG